MREAIIETEGGLEEASAVKEAVAVNQAGGERRLTIEKSAPDWLSTKTQAFWALFLCLILSLACFWQTTGIGFLLDDLLHFDYVARAMRGDWHDFLSNFYSNWGGSDLMLSYRPLISFSFFTDYLIWGANDFGYHLTNLLLLFACVCFVSLITLELTGSYANQLKGSAAVWAGLLFLLYPLHVESVAWIVGRVDLFCTVFYLASIFSFLRFRLTRDSFSLSVSLVAFVAALLSKEMAVTLPAVLCLYCLLFPDQPESSKLADANSSLSRVVSRNRHDLKPLALFFGLLALFALVRTLMLGATVGGYGAAGPWQILNSWRNFADLESLTKILVPVNEELSPVRAYSRFLIPAYLIILALLGYRAVKSPRLIKVIIFLACWAGIALLPTFQIWKIYPNLVGSRLFFLSSAPLCMLVAIAAIPVLDILSIRQARILAVIGTGCLIWTCSIYGTLTELNLKPWLEAGRRMSTIRRQLHEMAETKERFVLVDLPTDYQGAGLLTRPSYLRILCSPPLSQSDLSLRIGALQEESIKAQDQIDVNKLKALSNSKNTRLLTWSTEEGIYKPWREPGGNKAYIFNAVQDADSIETEPEAAEVRSDNWHTFSYSGPTLEKHENFLRIYPGARRPLSIYFPAAHLNPLEVASLDFQLTVHPGDTSAPEPVLVWQSRNGSGIEKLEKRDGTYTARVGKKKSWVLGGEVLRIGLQLPKGTYCADLKQLEGKGMAGQ